MKKLSLLLLLFFVCAACSSTDKEPVPGEQKVLLVSFDGFRADYLSKTETPNCDRLADNGILSDGLIPVFPTKTFPNHYSLVTGLYAENHGLVSNNMYDPEMDAYYRISDREAVENPAWYRGEPIWNTAEKQGLKAGSMFWVGSEAPVQGMQPSIWKSYDGSVPDSARIDSVTTWLSSGDEREVDLGLLYFSFTDDAGHRYGPESEEVIQAIRRADGLVGYLSEQLKDRGLSENTNIIIVSDHGMAGLSRERIVVLDEMIDPSDVEIIEYSPAMMLRVKEGADKEAVYQQLKSGEEHFSVYRKEDIPERFHLKNNIRIPDLLLVADLGYTINTEAYFSGNPNRPSGATHGFDNQLPEMQAVFLAKGPGLKKGLQIGPVANIEIYNLIAGLLNIKPAENDGNPDNIRSLLAN